MVSVAELRLLISGKDDTDAAFKSAKGNVDSLEKSTGGLGSTLGGVAKIASGFVVGAALTQLPNLIGGMIGGASDLNENLSKVQTVFGDSAGVIEDFSKKAATGMGLTKSEALAATGTLGNLFSAIGLGKDQMVNMSEGTVQLAGDLASFNNLSTDDALEKLRAGLVGEAEPLRSLGVNMNEAMVKAKGMELGLADAKGELSESAKVQARYAIIMEQTTTAQGDFARTSSGNANQMRILKAEFGNLRDELGTKLLPVVVSTGKFMLEYVVPAMARASEVVSDLISAGIDKIGGFLEDIRDPAQDVAEALVAWGQNEAIPTIQAFGETLRDTIIPAIKDFADTLRDKLQGPLEAITGFLGGKDEVLKSLGIAIGIVTGAVIAWSAAQAVLNVLLAANPVGALILGLTLLVAGIVLVVRNWDDIVAKFPALGVAADAVKTAIQVFTDWITTTFIPAVQKIFDTTSTVVGAVVTFVQEHWHQVWDAIKPVVDTIVLTITNMWTQIQTLFETTIAVIEGIIDVFVGIFTGDWDRAKAGVLEIVGALWGEVEGLFNGFLDFITGLSGIWTDKGKELLGYMFDGIKAIAIDLGNWFIDLPSKLLGYLGDIGSLLFNAGKDLIQGFINGIASMFGAVKDKLGDLTGSLTSWKGPPEKDAKILYGSGQLVIQGFIHGIESQVPALEGTLGAITNRIDDVVNTGLIPAVSQMDGWWNLPGAADLVKGWNVAPPQFASGGFGGIAGAMDPSQWGGGGGGPVYMWGDPNQTTALGQGANGRRSRGGDTHIHVHVPEGGVVTDMDGFVQKLRKEFGRAVA